ncbi:MAG TPA: cytochrome c peroxidase [Kofleriaceae bacterium]|nr:cytochrome c peroxidase [Kofleriaceae bacterium]
MRGVWFATLLAGCGAGCIDRPPPTKEHVGNLLFHDPNLSRPAGQGCVDCHDPHLQFADPEGDRSSAGVIKGRVGPRNAPTVMYASYVPPLHWDSDLGEYAGGLFWDGRADTLAGQAALPLLNPLEMNNPDKASVVESVRKAKYAGELRKIYGRHALDNVDEAFGYITDALGAFQRQDMFAPFSSKYDRYLAGKETLTAQEARGLAIFEDPARGNCASCHPSQPSAGGQPPMFTNYTYANLGLPKFRNSMFYMPSELNPEGEAYVDHGLGKTLGGAPEQDGKFRTPTLRNVARTPPYGHNGYFMNLREFVDFLNTRDVGSTNTVGTCSRMPGTSPACAWPVPEVAHNLDPRIGNLHLSDQDIDDLLAFLLTLNDE